MVAPLPNNRSYYWVCKQCQWQKNVGKSDCITITFEQCPKCHGEVELVTQENSLLTTAEQLIKKLIK